MTFLRTLALLAAAASLTASPAAAGSMRALAAPSAFTWVEDPHAADPCTEPGCVNHVKYGYNVVPINITSDAKVVMQEAKRPAGLAAVLNLETYTQPGCAISGCRMTKTLGIFPKEDCFNVQVSKDADQPDGKTTRIDFGGIYYENLPSEELYIKYEKKNYLTNTNTSRQFVPSASDSLSRKDRVPQLSWDPRRFQSASCLTSAFSNSRRQTQETDEEEEDGKRLANGMMSTKKQESIWTSFSRQQQRVVAAAHRPKRLSTELGDDSGNRAVSAAPGARVRSAETLAVVVKKRKVTATNDQLEEQEEGDAGIVTDGELLSSQEDYFCERRDTDFSVSDPHTDAVSDDIAGDEEGNAALEDGQDSELEEPSRPGVVAGELTQHLVTPEKSHMCVKLRHADKSSYSPRTAKLPLHAQKEFQRLRNLHQLGAANFVYIGATHTRFEHSLGVAYLAEQMVANIRVHQPWLGITDTDVLCIKIAGLCHDLGHGPFSHVFDGIFIKTLKRHKLMSETFNWTHEQGSLDMLDHLLASNHISIEEYGLSRQDLTFIKELIYGGPLPGSDGVLHGRPASNQRFLYDFVNNAQSGLDVDKLDYFMRDALHTGAKSSCDVDLLIRNARVLVDRDDKHGKMAVCFPEKLSGQVMQAFHTRFDLHQSVYQHKAIRAIEYMICDVFLAANDHMKIKDKRISDIVTNMSAYQHLDDRVLARIQESDNPELAKARAILNRMFTKPYYECVGKTRVTNHSSRKTEEMLLNEILCCSNKRHLVREKKDVIVEFMQVHFGKGDQDPLRHVRFYSKNACASATCYQIPSEAYEMHCPKTFQEHSIRVFVKEPRLVAPVREAFEAWSRKYNRSRVFPVAVATHGRVN